MSRCFAVLPLWPLVACGPELVEAPLEPLCGEDGPVELLELADGEEVGWVRALGDAGDLFVRTTDADESVIGAPSYWWRSVVVDACGEEVAELATEVSYVGRWDEALVGCIDSTDLVHFSSLGDPDPVVLARGGCGTVPVGERRVTLDVEPEAETGRLVAIEVSGSSVEVRGLLDDVVVGEIGYFPVAVEDRVFVQTGDLAVRSVDLVTGEVVVEVEQAERWAWSVRDDLVAYRPPVLDPEQPDPIVIRDRRTGVERILEAEIPATWWFGWAEDGLFAAVPPRSFGNERWFWLDTLQEVIAPEGMQIETVRSDGLVWLWRGDETFGELELFRWREGEEPQPAWSCTSCSIRPSRSATSIELNVATSYGNRYELWRLDDAGGPPRMLSDAAGYHYFVMDDGRVLTTVPGSDFEHGPLTLSDGTGGSPVTLAARVDHKSAIFTEQYDVSGDIIYATASHDGPGALYRARLAP